MDYLTALFEKLAKLYPNKKVVLDHKKITIGPDIKIEDGGKDFFFSTALKPGTTGSYFVEMGDTAKTLQFVKKYV